MTKTPTEEHLAEQLQRLADHARTTPAADTLPVASAMNRAQRPSRPLVLAVVVAVVVVIAGVLGIEALRSGSDSTIESAIPSPRPPGTALADGFVVAPNSELVGPVFSYPTGAHRGVSSRAILNVDRDPVQVYDEYVAEARRQGILIRGSGTTDIDGADTCMLLLPDGSSARATPPGSATAARASGTTGGTAPPTPTATAAPLTFPGSEAATRLDCTGGGKRTGTDPVTAGVRVKWGGPTHNAIVSVGPNVVLRFNDLGDARATPPARLPPVSNPHLATEPGEPFGQRNNAFDNGYRRMTLESGSRVAAEVDEFTVLHIDGDARQVMNAYAAQLGAGRQAPPVQEQTTPQGNVLTVENSPQGGGSAFLLTDPSKQWLLIETSSD